MKKFVPLQIIALCAFVITLIVSGCGNIENQRKETAAQQDSRLQKKVDLNSDSAREALGLWLPEDSNLEVVRVIEVSFSDWEINVKTIPEVKEHDLLETPVGESSESILLLTEEHLVYCFFPHFCDFDTIPNLYRVVKINGVDTLYSEIDTLWYDNQIKQPKLK